MDTGMIEIQANLRQFEVRRDVAERQRAAPLGPRGARRLPAWARRAVVSVASALPAALRMGH